ncbi:MAG: DNA repair protein RecN [Roseburia sp.]|nr:DNA repair protein RecN [Roseburia sp.]MCM1098309.1 DNA repair protein RecN [Ruminococcus flavefaciens]
MLQSLHVKNLALIEETEVEFTEGLNILTGETGAGKSLLIGSINLALGGKFEREMLRKGADSALVELIFTGNGPRVREKLEQMELEPSEEDTVIISRRLSAGKSVCRINGETVTAKQVKELAETLIDIHGQHEHQSLLNRRKHMEILDSYCGTGYERAAEAVRQAFFRCAGLRKTLQEESMDEEARQKEQSLAEFEVREIQEASLKPGEDEELEQRYRLMTNSKRILEGLSESRQLTGNDGQDGAGEALSRALRAMRGVSGFDPRLQELEEQLAEIDSLLADYNRDVAEYMADCEFDEKDFETTERRLNLLNHLKGKYGDTVEEVLEYERTRRGYLEKLADYDVYLERMEKELKKAETELEKACEKLSKIRKRDGAVLQQKLKDALIHLNFSAVEFEITVSRAANISASGWDEVEFRISTNPGEPLMSLSQVASGGELSRVMLAIKTVLAGRDEIDTLIFDEIDAGISGRTAWRVSEQLNAAAKAHQVICITHLPQIAAMADHHLCIEKSSTEANTITNIRSLDAEEGLGELARLLGSDTATDAALSNAREMRTLALKQKGI